MNKTKPVKISLLANKERYTSKKENYCHREIVGSLLYLSTKTRHILWILVVDIWRITLKKIFNKY